MKKLKPLIAAVTLSVLAAAVLAVGPQFLLAELGAALKAGSRALMLG